METKVIQWMDRTEAERLLEQMKDPVKRSELPASSQDVVVLKDAPATERSYTAAQSYRVESL